MPNLPEMGEDSEELEEIELPAFHRPLATQYSHYVRNRRKDKQEATLNPLPHHGWAETQDSDPAVRLVKDLLMQADSHPSPDAPQETQQLWKEKGKLFMYDVSRDHLKLCPDKLRDKEKIQQEIPEQNMIQDHPETEETLHQRAQVGNVTPAVEQENPPSAIGKSVRPMHSSTEDQSSHSGHETENHFSADEQQTQAQVPVAKRCVPQREEDFIDNDLLITLVQERVALWDTREQQHSDAVVIWRLWNEVAQALMDDWDIATSRVRKAFLIKVKTRWCSMKDHFNKDPRQEIQVHSGAAARIGKYKYHRLFAFLRPVLGQRTTCSSTLEPRSSSRTVLHQTATDQSQPSTSEAASGLASQAGEQAAGPSEVPLSQSSASFLGALPVRRPRTGHSCPSLFT
ncbi:uncharacterized protein [Ranitomeya imitator]|uniref:uncharacterized protein n=1 Tax=Ranitomeya imitator TaxID=111125 RepID=UPI0037E92CB0